MCYAACVARQAHTFIAPRQYTVPVNVKSVMNKSLEPNMARCTCIECIAADAYPSVAEGGY